MNPTSFIWLVCGLLIFVGLLCMVLRRQLLAMILGLELLLNATNLSLVYYAAQRQDAKALAIALLIIAVAAAEAVVGISLLLTLSFYDAADPIGGSSNIQPGHVQLD